MKKLMKKYLALVVTMLSIVMMSSCQFNDAVTGGADIDLEGLQGLMQYRASGQVRDVINGEPLVGVTIRVYLDDIYVIATSSNELGLYDVSLPRQATYTFILEKEDYEKVEEIVTIPSDINILAKDFQMNYIGHDDPVDPEDDRDLDYIISDKCKWTESGNYSGTFRSKVIEKKNELGRITIETSFDSDNMMERITYEDGSHPFAAKIICQSVYNKEIAEAMTKAATMTQQEQFMCGVRFDGIVGDAGDRAMTYTNITGNDYIMFSMDEICVDAAIVKYYANGAWTVIPKENYSKIDNTKILINPEGFGIYAIFFELNVIEEEGSDKEFNIGRWKNTTENTTQYIKSTGFKYTIGSTISPTIGQSIAQALLVDQLMRNYGFETQEVESDFDMKNFALLPGFAVIVDGRQYISKKHYTTPDYQPVLVTTSGSVSVSVFGYRIKGPDGQDHEGSYVF